jgi:hypothetical protein
VLGAIVLWPQGEPEQLAYLGNISRTGLGLYTRTPLRPQRLVVVALRMLSPDGQAVELQEGEDPLKVAARVRWCRAAGDLHMVGLEFEKLSNERYQSLLAHLKLLEELQG